jgi:carbon monoxide dehydrogenase subunit G
VPEAECATTSRLSIEVIWDFVRDMDRWAPFLTGYQSHEKQGPDDSLWVLKGDVGVLSRTVKFRVHVTEWAGPTRVCFALEGVNEPLRGEGSFRLERAGEAASAPPGEATLRRRFFARLLEPMVRLVLRLFRGGRQRPAAAAPDAGAQGATLRLRLRIDPGGPMAPMLSALIAPALLPAAEDLAERIVAHLEAQHTAR